MKSVRFNYKNHRGEIALRTVVPKSVDFRVNAHRDDGYNYQPGWFLTGFDVDKQALRSFALVNIQLDDTLAGQDLEWPDVYLIPLLDELHAGIITCEDVTIGDTRVHHRGEDDSIFVIRDIWTDPTWRHLVRCEFAIYDRENDSVEWKPCREGVSFDEIEPMMDESQYRKLGSPRTLHGIPFRD